jgi:hypothetical protein
MNSMREHAPVSSFVERAYLARLRNLQNEDGGWGFTAGCESRIEPTAWALVALHEFDSSLAVDETLDRGLHFLTGAQLENGSWAAAPGQREGCWVTSLACWTLLAHRQHATSLLRGLRWLNDDRPRDSGFWWRLARRLAGRQRINAQSASFSGWSWTPHTASWVEPTCYALIVLRAEGAASLSNLHRRGKLAEAMLYDRMCPGGGWNCGNPRVYGVAGQPQVGPTVWALIALHGNTQRPENHKSLDWLESIQGTIRSPESLALAHIGLGVYGRLNSALTERLRSFHETETLPWSVQAIAWAALAFSETSQWLHVVSSTNS